MPFIKTILDRFFCDAGEQFPPPSPVFLPYANPYPPDTTSTQHPFYPSSQQRFYPSSTSSSFRPFPEFLTYLEDPDPQPPSIYTSIPWLLYRQLTEYLNNRPRRDQPIQIYDLYGNSLPQSLIDLQRGQLEIHVADMVNELVACEVEDLTQVRRLVLGTWRRGVVGYMEEVVGQWWAERRRW